MFRSRNVLKIEYIDIACEKIIQFVQDKETREKNKCLE